MRRTRTKIALYQTWFRDGSSSSRQRQQQQQQQQQQLSSSCRLTSQSTSAVLSIHASSSSSTNTMSSIDHNTSSCIDTKTSTTGNNTSTDIWRGDTTPFSEYAEHVQVSNDDLPVSIQSAILRSMRTVGARSPFSSDHRVLIIDGDDGPNNQQINQQDDEYPYPTTTTTMLIAAQVQDHPPGRPMTPQQLLYVGAVWYLSATDYQRNQEQQQQQVDNDTKRGGGRNIVKPIRLSLENATQLLAEGDYLRIHHTPRRFPQVYQADWSFPTASAVSVSSSSSFGNSNSNNSHTSEDENRNNHNDDNNFLPWVVQQEGLGYCIIEKPSLIPVHATVDNVIENVVHQLVLSKQHQQQQQHQSATTSTYDDDNNMKKNENENVNETPYFASVQRLDIHTSGLLVIATTPEFAAYFSKLLRYKTKHRNNSYNNDNHKTKTNNNGNTTNSNFIDVENTAATATSVLHDTNNRNNNSSNNNNNKLTTVEKGYKCLVCLQSTKEESILQAYKRLFELCSTNNSNNNNNDRSNIIQHYLKVSDRSHKVFVDQIPPPSNNNNNNNNTNHEKGDTNNYSDSDTNNDDGEGNQNTKWLECLMVMTHVSEPIPLFQEEENNNNTRNTTSLTDHLWPTRSMRVPTATKAVVEVTVNLITGRTHQIRGQLSHLGFPIVGDEHYGGGECATTTTTTVTATNREENEDEEDHHRKEDTVSSPQEVQCGEQQQAQQQQLLALQCCALGFPEAEYDWVWNKKKRKEIPVGRLPSPNGDNRNDHRWVQATLEKAWWTPFVEKYHYNNSTTAHNGVINSDIDYQTVDDNDVDDKNDEISDTLPLANNTDTNDTETETETNDSFFRPDLLPPSVQLSPGRHKYIVAKLRDPLVRVVNDGTTDVVQSSIPPRKVRWFVISAAAQDCGGPYHVNVAQQLLEWIQCVPGYETADVVITGGGRIDYHQMTATSTVRVYGFSYRYGKGDHKRVATMIQDSLLLGATDTDTTTTVVTYDDSDELY